MELGTAAISHKKTKETYTSGIVYTNCIYNAKNATDWVLHLVQLADDLYLQNAGRNVENILLPYMKWVHLVPRLTCDNPPAELIMFGDGKITLIDGDDDNMGKTLTTTGNFNFNSIKPRIWWS